MNPVHEGKNMKYTIPFYSKIMEQKKVNENSNILLVTFNRQLLLVDRTQCMSLGFATGNNAYVSNMKKNSYF